MTFQIWTEGWRSSDGSATASFEGEFEGESFDEAVENYLKDREKFRWKDIRQLYYKRDGYHSVWGCRLFDNEADARKGFG
jgi:hypothetical protein